MKALNELISDGVKAEKDAISYYTFILPYIHNGNYRRSVEHILKEEKEHLKFMERLAEKARGERI